MFAVKAAKKGVLFPIVVDVAAIVALATGLALFYFLFQRGETQLAREDTATITAEGKLLQEVKKESDAKLQEKNQQINQIQDRLAEIDKQRQDLQSNMDAKVQEKEGQLRAAMAAELDAEKARLQKQGLSDQDIQKKLADMETQKNADFTKQLNAFKAQADADRQKSEATLKTLTSQFNTDLAKANAERQQVLADSKQREADLQAQLAQKTKEMASAQAQTQAQLATLTSQKQQEDLASQQLVGLYAVAQADIAAKNYPKALASLQAITGYVNSADVAVLPGIAKRRTVDLFIVDSLSTLVQGEIDKGKVDTASLVDAAGKIADVRSKVASADGLLKAGKLADAETQYGQALSVIPEIAKSYAYFTAKARDAEAERQDVLHAGLTRAESAFAAGRYADVPSAYRDALTYLPETSARLAALLSNIGAAGIALAAQKTQAEQTQAAAPVIAASDAMLKQAQFSDAMAQYLSVLQNYPQSQQAAQAVKGINDCVAGLNRQAAADLKNKSDQVTGLNSQLTGVRKQLDASLAEILSIKKSIIALLGLKQDPAAADSAALLTLVSQRYGDLTAAMSASSDVRKSLDAAAQKNADLTAQVTRLSSDNARLTADLNAARQEADRQRQLAAQTPDALKSAQAAGSAGAAAGPAAGAGSGQASADQKRLAEFEGLVAAYVAYAKQEDDNLGKHSQQKALMLSVGARDSFFASLGKFFDGFLGRVKRYESQSSTDGIDTGRRKALDDVISLMTGLANQKTADAQKSFLDARLASEKDPKMLSLLGYLQRIAASH
jgi:DNA repair exonuclease SbcCD ATPase subunit